MSSLRRRLTQPGTYLAAVAFGAALIGLDALRPAGEQLTGRAYLSAVNVYQQRGRPLTRGIIACRYRPTCSEYSKQTVAKFGIARGLILTIRRLGRCRSDVPEGTWDAPPEAD